MKLHVSSLLSGSSRSRLVVAIGSAMVIAAFTLILPATDAKSDTLGSTGALKEAGVLRLHLGSTGPSPQDYFGLQRPDPQNPGQYLPIPAPPNPDAATDRQTISTSSGCKLSLTAPSTLTTFTPEASTPAPSTGFVSDAIGVGAKGEGNGQPCGRIDAPGQTLTMDLGSTLDGKLIDYAEIDAELKFGATLVITGFIVKDDGTSDQVGEAETYSSVGSDSGPDSLDGDNYRIRFPIEGFTAVNRLKFSIESTGGASLEGGADQTLACSGTNPDGTDDSNSIGCQDFSLGQTLKTTGITQPGTTDTLFHLIEADGVLDCGDETPDPTTEPPFAQPFNQLERLNNVGNTNCVPIAFDLDSQVGAPCQPNFTQCVLLLKDLLDQDAQFFWTVTWSPETGQYPESQTVFDFDFDGILSPIQLCDPDVPQDGFPDLPLSQEAGDPPGTLDPWCLVGTSTTYLPSAGPSGETLVFVTEKYFGSGDPLGKRG